MPQLLVQDPPAGSTPISQGPDPFQVGQVLGAFLVWAADHADDQERAALRALLDRQCRRDQLPLVRRLCERYPDMLRARLARDLVS